jgi:hypothetical protein
LNQSLAVFAPPPVEEDFFQEGAEVLAQPDQLLAQLRTQASSLRHEADRLKAQSTQAKVIFSFPKSVSSSISDPDPHTGRPKLSPKKGKKEEI